jgi:AraC-like DNA-binding protein
MSIIAIAHDCGFSTVSHFHRVFRRHFGTTPGEAREQAR